MTEDKIELVEETLDAVEFFELDEEEIDAVGGGAIALNTNQNGRTFQDR